MYLPVSAWQPETFGSLLRRLRLERKLSQGGLAERAHMSVEAVSALERGFRRSPQGTTVALLISALELDAADARKLENAVESRALRPAKADGPPGMPLVRTNLPYAIDKLIGRNVDLDAISALVKTNRIVTIVGPGGIGKTRVAIEIARRALDSCDDGVFIVDLAVVGTEASIGKAIAEAIGVPSQSGDATGAIVEGVGHRNMLLLLDNCEHIAAEVGAIVRTLSTSCPRLTMLITSRQPINVTGESVYRLATLDNKAAVSLFEERALAADATFTTDERSRTTIADLCKKLDGLPLAIELVAARVATLGVSDLLKRVDRPLRLIGRSDSTGHSRQSTMRAMLDWSYALLDARERAFFLGLSTFTGGWTLESAHAVAGPDNDDDFVTLELLESLIAKSFVLRESRPGRETRYRMLQTIHAYGVELVANAGTRDTFALRAIAYYRDLLRAIDPMDDLGAREGALRTLTEDNENIRIAIDDAVRIAPREAIAIIGASDFLTTYAGMNRELALWVDVLEPHLDESDPIACCAFWRRAVTAYAYAGSTFVAKRNAAIERSVTAARASGEPNNRVLSLVQNIIASTEAGNFDESHALVAEAMAIGGVRARAALALLQVRTHFELASKHFDQAKDLLRAIVSGARKDGTASHEISALESLIEIAVLEDDLRAAIALAKEIDPAGLPLNTKYGTMTLAGVPNIASIAGNRLGAYESARELIKSFDGYYLQKFSVVRVAALSFAHVGQYEKAAVLEGFARKCTLKSDEMLAPASSALTERVLLAILNERLSADRLREALREGERLDHGDANALASSLTDAEVARLAAVR